MKAREDLIKAVKAVITDSKIAYEIGDRVLSMVAVAIKKKQEEYKEENQPLD